MKIQRDKLHQYQKRITVITDREKEIARECLRKGDKKKALLALQRKKYQESLLAKTDAQLAQLEILTSDVEFALVQKDVLFGLQQGTAVLKEIHREMGGIENVEKLLGESAEAQAYQKVSHGYHCHCAVNTDDILQQEVSELLSGQLTNQDEDEVEDELAALAAEVNGVQQLPDAPTELPENEELQRETPKERARRRERERAAEQAAQPMLA